MIKKKNVFLKTFENLVDYIFVSSRPQNSQLSWITQQISIVFSRRISISNFNSLFNKLQYTPTVISVKELYDSMCLHWTIELAFAICI